MHHVPIKRPLTMPSGPKAALDYPSMLQLAAKRCFDFHEYSDWVSAAQLRSDEVGDEMLLRRRTGAANVRDVSHDDQ